MQGACVDARCPSHCLLLFCFALLGPPVVVHVCLLSCTASGQRDWLGMFATTGSHQHCLTPPLSSSATSRPPVTWLLCKVIRRHSIPPFIISHITESHLLTRLIRNTPAVGAENIAPGHHLGRPLPGLPIAAQNGVPWLGLAPCGVGRNPNLGTERPPALIES